MTFADRLAALAATLPVLHGMPIGVTGYLDGPIQPPERAVGGKDAHGRAFVTVCCKALFRSARDAQAPDVWHFGVATVFQRYSDDANVLTQANNRGRVSLVCSKMTEGEWATFRALVCEGSAEVRIHGGMQGDGLERFKLCTYDEVVRSQTSRKYAAAGLD